jgi:pantoate--beta-alanine ligase
VLVFLERTKHLLLHKSTSQADPEQAASRASSMRVITDKAEMRAWSRERRAAGQRIGFVPTMGFLHSGHLGLVALAKERAQAVVVSIYVNPTQFAAHEDFDTYPTERARDHRCARIALHCK